jgi:hypothetical protein
LHCSKIIGFSAKRIFEKGSLRFSWKSDLDHQKGRPDPLQINGGYDNHSEKRLTDVQNLMRAGFDTQFVRAWAERLNLVELLDECEKGKEV